MGRKFDNQNEIVMTLEKYGAILQELETMERWYETEEELAAKAGTSVMGYSEFVEDGLKRISERQGVEIDIVRDIYNKTKNAD